MTEWRAPEQEIRRALAAQAEPKATTDDELFRMGYITSDHDERQRALRDAARDARMLRQAPEAAAQRGLGP